MGTGSRQDVQPSADLNIKVGNPELSQGAGYLTSTKHVGRSLPEKKQIPENLMVKVSISHNGKSIEEYFLVDTGACGVFLHLDLARQLYGSGFPSKTTETSKCIVANEHVEETFKGLRSSLSVQGRSVNCKPFVMSSLSFRGIIGYSTLGALGFMVDTVNHRLLTVSDIPVESTVDDPVASLTALETDDLGSLMASKAIDIQPRSAKLVPVLLSSNRRINEFCLIRENINGSLPKGLAVVSSLATVINNYADVFILNTTGMQIDIPRGIIIASASRIDHRPVCRASSIRETHAEHGGLNAIGKRKQFLSQFNLPDVLTQKQRETVEAMLWRERSVFSESDFDIGLFKGVTHHIDTGEEKPYKETLRRHSPKTREEIKSLVKEMLDHGIIQPSFSPWSSAPVLVTKKSGGKRFAIDYRGLNAKTKKDSYPLPQIADALDCFSGSVWFSKIDMTQGFWQIELDKESRKKTAFTTPQGLYEFVRMPFGLCNAPACFQRAMTCCLEGLNWEIALCFLDDVIVFAKDFDTHLERLQIIFRRLRDNNLKIKPKKCEFLQTEVTYLGHKVSKDGISTDPAKIETIKNYVAPKTVTQLRSFLGMAQYYRRFVKDFSLIASPLHDQVKKDAKTIKWGNEENAAFLEIKRRLASTPIMSHPDFTKEFIVDTDASNLGIGCVLSQIIDGREHVIAYNSHKFNKAERKWCTTDREFFALYTAVRLFRSYLYGREFILRTDHQALVGLVRKAKDLFGKQSRWWAYLSNFNYKVIYRQGSSHANADGLSRQPQFEVEDESIGPINLTLLKDSPAEPIEIMSLQQGIL